MSEEDDGQRSDISRRSVIRNTAALGVLAAGGGRVGAALTETDVDLDSVLNHRSVSRLVREVPGLQLDRQAATVYGSNESVVAVPTNYGKLVATVPGRDGPAWGGLFGATGGDDVDAALHFDQWVPGVDDAWIEGTEARLSTTDDGVVLERSATEAEKQALLSALDRPEFDDANVVVVPDSDTVQFTRIDTDEGVMQTVEAVAEGAFQRSADIGVTATGLEVVAENTFTKDDMVEDISIQGSCTDELMWDLVLCLVDYIDCFFCIGITGGTPVVVACWIIVCLDGGLALAMEYLSDWGCAAAGGHALDCLERIVDEYGDEVPI